MMVDASCYNNFIPEENISFSGGDLSSDTGALPLLDFLFSNELYAPYRSLPYSDHRSYTSAHTSNHSLFSQITSRFLPGCFNQSDQDVLKDDPLLHQYFPDAASQASVSRFFSRISEDSVIAFQQLLMDQACCFIHHHCHDVILDADSAKTDTYGNQEEADWIYHDQQVGYHPFTVNEFSTKVLAASLLRPGKTFSAARADVILKEVLDRIPSITADGRQREIRFRGDAAFYFRDLMELFENRECPVGYAIRAKNTSKMVRCCLQDYDSSNHEENSRYSSSNPFFGEITYQMSGSDKERRVCYKLYFSEDLNTDKDGIIQIQLIPTVFAVITNLESDSYSSKDVIEFYSQRGASENFTKELKKDFNANTLSHRKFASNAFEFLLKSLAYNIFRFFQYRVLEKSDRKCTASTFRKKYQKTASRISTHARKIYLRIAASFRHQNQFIKYLRKSRTVGWLSGL